MNGSFSYLVSCRARLHLCELRIFLRRSCCSLRWLLLENLPAQLGFSLITPTLVCFCFGSDSWWCVLFEGRATVAVSDESELFRVFLCLRDVLCFFVGPTEDRYFATNELLLNLILTHCWMLLVLSSGVWFWSWSSVLFGHFYGKNLLFVLASRLILHIVRVMVNACIMTKCRIFYWYILSELICHLFEEVMFWVNLYVTSWKKWFFLKTVFVWMTLR